MSPLQKKVLIVALSAATVCGIVCADVILRARHAYLEGEKASSGQLAFMWYETASTLFVPPESKWSRAAREKMPIAKERWRAELEAKGIRVEESMLE